MSAIPAREVVPRRSIDTSPACAPAVAPDTLADGLQRLRTRTSLATTVVAGVLLVVAVGLSVAGRAELSLVACAGVLGWLNLSGGPCAQNALTAITPLAIGPSNATWYKATIAYTLAGLASSTMLGLLLGTLGMVIGLEGFSSTVVLWIVGWLAAYAVLRDGLGIPLPFLQPKRSSRMSFGRLGQPTAAILWGLDVGSFFSTWLTYAGAWWLVAVGVCSASPALAAALFGAHWLGRSTLVWLGRWMIPDANEGHRLPAVWDALQPRFRRLYAGVVLGATVMLVIA